MTHSASPPQPLPRRRTRDAGAPSRAWWRRLPVDPLGVLGVVLLLLLWVALTFVVPVASLPAPGDVVARVGADFWAAPELSFYGLDTGLAESLAFTATNVFVAVTVGSVFGVTVGLMTARLPLLRQIVDPFMWTAGTIPILVLAPFFLIWFGVGRSSAVLLVTFYVFVMLYVFAQKAAANLSPIYEEAARTFGASPRRVLRDVLLPGTLPEILGGVRIALAGAWGLECITELLGAQSGMGKIIQVLAGATDVQGIFAALVVLGLAAIICDGVAVVIVARATQWQSRATPGALLTGNRPT